MNRYAMLAFVIAFAVTFALGIQSATPDRVVLDLSQWRCSDREIDGCAEWRREHNHEMSGSAKR